MVSKLKIINSNKKMNDWFLQLEKDLKMASENVRKMKRKTFSYDNVISEFKRIAHKDLSINNYTLGIDLSGVYFLDNKKNPNYLFLIIRTDSLIPVENDTRNWKTITVNDYLMEMTERFIEDQVEQISFELKSTEKRQKELSKNMNKSINYLNKQRANYKETIRLGRQKITEELNPSFLSDDEYQNNKTENEGE